MKLTKIREKRLDENGKDRHCNRAPTATVYVLWTDMKFLLPG